jgi:hypothetical protein
MDVRDPGGTAASWWDLDKDSIPASRHIGELRADPIR